MKFSMVNKQIKVNEFFCSIFTVMHVAQKFMKIDKLTAKLIIFRKKTSTLVRVSIVERGQGKKLNFSLAFFPIQHSKLQKKGFYARVDLHTPEMLIIQPLKKCKNACHTIFIQFTPLVVKNIYTKICGCLIGKES